MKQKTFVYFYGFISNIGQNEHNFLLAFRRQRSHSLPWKQQFPEEEQVPDLLQFHQVLPGLKDDSAWPLFLHQIRFTCSLARNSAAGSTSAGGAPKSSSKFSMISEMSKCLSLKIIKAELPLAATCSSLHSAALSRNCQHGKRDVTRPGKQLTVLTVASRAWYSFTQVDNSTVVQSAAGRTGLEEIVFAHA